MSWNLDGDVKVIRDGSGYSLVIVETYATKKECGDSIRAFKKGLKKRSCTYTWTNGVAAK